MANPVRKFLVQQSKTSYDSKTRISMLSYGTNPHTHAVIILLLQIQHTITLKLLKNLFFSFKHGKTLKQ